MDNSGPQFKQVGAEIDLNNHDLFWVPFEASHISYKNGRLSFWLLENCSLEDEEKNYNKHYSKNKRNFTRKEGNCLRMPDFKKSFGTGYLYYPILWEWRCRKCQKQVSRIEILNSKEVCLSCQRQTLKPPALFID